MIRSSLIFLVSWGLFNLASASSLVFAKSITFNNCCRGLSVIAQEFGYNVNSFVAGLGIGGLAFALAAKDALANLFGGIVIGKAIYNR
ncbi:mechanosensitive ion channel domain-containing protein [Bacillus sp. FJAT-50079]|uniref:mechanosensitive ion channel domain-containing protein n=1 Tax=Bacillus sp. FJAT-50079 TaxID=2833577 RepID=UPI00201633D9|nr:mechanosensitive ion channel domain-containing protein [Bacillus sp. FJAT-50079]